MSSVGRRILIAASDSGAGLAGMRVQAFELGSRVARAMVQRGFEVDVAIRADDEAFAAAVHDHGANVLALPVGRGPLDRLAGFYGKLSGALGRADLVYSLNPKLPHKAIGRCKTAMTIHDFCYLEYPSEFDLVRRAYYWLNQRYLLPRADVVFTVSADVATKLRRHFPQTAAERVVVASNGLSQDFDPAALPSDYDRITRHFGIDGCYFLFLGKLSPRKNLALIIRAAKVLCERGLQPLIVVAGPPGWREDADWALIEQLGVQHCFRRLGYLESADISVLLRRSAGLLYPSRCEGFGLPVLEGLRTGIPVVVARDTVCAENAGPFAFGVGADDVGEMATIMARLLTDPPVSPDPLSVSAHLAQYDWNVSAGIIAGHLERLLSPQEARNCPALPLSAGFSLTL